MHVEWLCSGVPRRGSRWWVVVGAEKRAAGGKIQKNYPQPWKAVFYFIVVERESSWWCGNRNRGVKAWLWRESRVVA